MFTSVLVQALATGEADRGGDGLVSVDELYDYIYDEVRTRTTLQTPNRLIEVEGEMVVARAPSPLPDELLQLVADPDPAVRVGAVRPAIPAVPASAPARRPASGVVAAPAARGWAPPRPGDADRVEIAWRATVTYLVCCFGGLAFVADRRPEARFHAWQSILYAAAAFLVFLLSSVVASIACGSPSETETSATGSDPGLFAPIFLSVYLGGRLLLVVPAWLGRHVRLPLLGRFAETLAMRRY